jgi:predicted GIY-YIG superfamily endonuclease
VPWSAKQLSWSLSAILFEVPATSGIYCIWRHEVPVYVGESEDLLRRLLEHFKGGNECIAREHPTSFSFEVVSEASRATRQESLVREMRPICNSAN